MDFLMFHSVRYFYFFKLEKNAHLVTEVIKLPMKLETSVMGKTFLPVSGVCTIGEEIFKELSNTISVL